MCHLVPASTTRADAPDQQADRYLWPFLIAVAVVAANFPGIVGITNVNPLMTYAGLTVSRGTQLVPGTSTIDINVGATSQALGHRAALDWLHGHIPWWNPYEGVGTPLAAGMQAAAFFPPTLLLAFSGGQLAFRLLLEYTAGLCTYFLLRRLAIRTTVAGIGGMVFALNGTFAWFQHAAINPVAFLPAAILGIEVARERGLGDWRSLLLPIALALSITAGFPETTFYDDGLVVLWALWRVVALPSWEERGRLAGRMAVLGGGGVLLTAPLVLAFRSYLAEGNVGAHTGMAHVHLPASNLLTLIDPYITGPLKAYVAKGPASIQNLFITNSGYLLVSAFVLAIAGLLLWRRELGLRIILALWVVVISLRNFGFRPVLDVFAHIPYVKLSAVFRSAVPSIEFAFVVLAAFGIEAVIEGRSENSRARRWHLPVIALLTGCLLAGLAAGPSREVLHLVWSGTYSTDPHHYIIPALALTVLVLVGLMVAGALRGRIAVFGLCGILLCEAAASFIYPEFAATRSPTIDTRPVTYLEQHLGDQRFYSLYNDPTVGPEYGGPIAPNYGSYFGLASADYLDIPDPTLYVDYVQAHLDPGAGSEFFGTTFGRHAKDPNGLVELIDHVKNFESIGVKYVVIGAAFDLKHYIPSATEAYHDSLVGIWELPHVTGYYSVVSGSCRLQGHGFDDLVATCTGPSRVQRAELDLAGWSATVNGRPASLSASHDGLFTTVSLPAGRSTVTWSYRPGHLRLGEGLAALGALVLLAPFLLRLYRRLRAR